MFSTNLIVISIYLYFADFIVNLLRCCISNTHTCFYILIMLFIDINVLYFIVWFANVVRILLFL